MLDAIAQRSAVTARAVPAARVEVFGFDVAEVSQIRRIRALRALGHDVHSFTMRRRNMNADFIPDWSNTHLYETENEALGKRAAVVARSMLCMAGHRTRLRASDVIIARNMDMLAIAVAGRAMARSPAALVYECLDIHGSLTGQGAKARAMRAAERALLRQVDLLAVSSPGFIRNYFGPVQGYQGPHVLWENKLTAGAVLPPRPEAPEAPLEGPLRIGWVGTIRCAPSLSILADAARALGDTIEIHIHGVVHHHVLPDFDAVVAALPNIRFHGPYAYPEDLSRIYGALDLVWAQDLWQAGANSDWLLPNRIYEASWAGCPSLAVASTETGRRIEEDQLGWTVPAPGASALTALLAQLDRPQIVARRSALLARPATDFVQTPEDLSTGIDEMAACSRARRARQEGRR